MSEFVCPWCSKTSHHPKDAETGYCGRCHAFTRDNCPCGEPLHYVNELTAHHVEKLIAEQGARQRIEVLGGDVYLVPRRYIALHGVAAQELPVLVGSYSIERAANHQ